MKISVFFSSFIYPQVPIDYPPDGQTPPVKWDDPIYNP